MQRVVFLIYHGMSHFNACFRMARLLKENYDVIFAGFRFFQSHVKAQGFSYHSLKTVPFGLGFEHWVNATLEKKKNAYWHSLKDRWSNRLYHLRDAELHEMITALRPDYLLIDSWQSTDFIVLYPYLRSYGIKVAFIQTMLSLTVDKGVPPLNSLAPPTHHATRRAHLQFHADRWIWTLVQKLKYTGKDNTVLVNAAIRRNKIPQRYLPKKRSLFSPAFNHIDEFILAPLEMDFPGRPFLPHQHHIGFMIDTQRADTVTETFRKVETLLSRAPRQPVLYCSFGSIAYKHTKPIIRFLEKLIEVVKTKTYVLIIASPIRAVRDHFKALPANVFVVDATPQLQMLSRASVLITHGGFNSIKESIHATVPMLVYPVYKHADQRGNAARVLYHGVGLIGDLKRDSEADIEKKLHELITNASYKEKTAQLKRSGSAYPDSHFLELFNAIKPLNQG